MSQIELVCRLTAHTGKNGSFCEFSRIKNNCANIPQEQWQVLISVLAAVFEADIAWFQEIHDSTPLKTLDTSQVIFPIYLKNS